MTMRRRFAAALAGVALFVVTATSGAGWTQATWTDQEYTSGAFATKTIPPPTTSAQCTLVPGLAGANPVVTVFWQFASGSGYTVPTNIRYYKASSANLANLTEIVLPTGLTTTGPVSGVYTTTFASNLLTGLLGGSYLVGLRATENGWTSTLASWTASMTALGGNATCNFSGQNP